MNQKQCQILQSDQQGKNYFKKTNLFFLFLNCGITRFNADEFLRVEDLPPPKKIEQKEPEPDRPKPAVQRQVGIADQIAIRSYVLGKAAKTGFNKNKIYCQALS